MQKCGCERSKNLPQNENKASWVYQESIKHGKIQEIQKERVIDTFYTFVHKIFSG